MGQLYHTRSSDNIAPEQGCGLFSKLSYVYDIILNNELGIRLNTVQTKIDIGVNACSKHINMFIGQSYHNIYEATLLISISQEYLAVCRIWLECRHNMNLPDFSLFRTLKHLICNHFCYLICVRYSQPTFIFSVRNASAVQVAFHLTNGSSK